MKLNRYAFCGAFTVNRVRESHIAVCQPSVNRMAHFVRIKNLPYSLVDICEMTTNYKERLEIMQQFTKTETTTLMKATQPFERLNLKTLKVLCQAFQKIPIS